MLRLLTWELNINLQLPHWAQPTSPNTQVTDALHSSSPSRIASAGTHRTRHLQTLTHCCNLCKVHYVSEQCSLGAQAKSPKDDRHMAMFPNKQTQHKTSI